MNYIDLFKYPRFPLSAETIDFLQQMAVMMSKAAGIGGDNFILSGCTEVGSNVSPGFIVIAGELMPFTGGVKQTYIVIEQTKRSVTAEGQVYNGIYVSRQARFGTGLGQLTWSNFKRISLPDIEARIDSIVPAGVIVMWSGEVAPQGWALCDGEDGTPDLRGRFIVGKSAVETDFAELGQTGGAKKVALTVDQIPAHTHAYSAPLTDGSHPGGSSGYDRPNGKQTGQTGSAGNGDMHENLPPYYVLAYIIKL